jgi:tetratricopeptide (TPR) repeat protein
LGDIYRIRGQWTAADECYQRAMSALTATGSPQSLFHVNLSLGLINMERKRYAKAQEYLDQCWSITSHGFGFTSRMASVKSHMGELSIRIGALAEAEAHADEAIALAKEADVRQELAHATMVKGIVDIQRRNWGEALEHCRYAHEVFEDLGDKYNTGRIHAVFGQLYLERHQDAEDRQTALQHLSKAREIFEQLEAKTELDRLPRG